MNASSRPGICPPGPTGATGPYGAHPEPTTVGASSVSEQDLPMLTAEEQSEIIMQSSHSYAPADFGPLQHTATEPYSPTVEDYAAMDNDGIIPPKPKERFKLTLKKPYPHTHPLARVPGNLFVYVYGEELEDHILIHADINPDDIADVDRVGQFDPNTNTIVDDPEVTTMIDKSFSA